MFRIGKYLISHYVNGPGKRFVIWFQGCPFRCKGCFNPEFWDENGGECMDVKDMIHLILNADAVEKLDGVTFTGGEPFMQAKNILPLAREIKSNGLSIVSYTGYLLQDILNGNVPYGNELIKYIDILIDGKFIEEEKAPLIWRGSRNQKVYFLTDRYKYLEKFVNIEGEKEMEILVGEDKITTTGMIDLELWERLKMELKNGGKR